MPGGNGVFRPMVVRSGRVVGTWRRTVTKSAVNIEVEFFGELVPSPSLTVAAQRYCDFVGLPLGAVIAN